MSGLWMDLMCRFRSFFRLKDRPHDFLSHTNGFDLLTSWVAMCVFRLYLLVNAAKIAVS